MVAQPENRAPKRSWQGIAALIAVLLATLLSPAKANEAGLSWLSAQQQTDGGLTATADETFGAHATLEAVRVLRLFDRTADPAYSTALQYLTADTSQGFPYIPYRLVTLHFSNSSLIDIKDELLSYQNADGGFGGYAGGQSSVIDTLDAIDALTEAGINDRALIAPAIQYLLTKQRPDGGFSHDDLNHSAIYLTARCASVFQRYLTDYGLSSPLQSAAAFLWQSEQSGGWSTDWEISHALLALIPITTDATRYANNIANLRARQMSDGSWSGSVYATALALRALYIADHRSPPQGTALGSAAGMVVDSATKLPVAGVQVVLQGHSVETRTSESGKFQIDALPAGDYVLEYHHAGYTTVAQPLTVQAAEHRNVGTILLQSLASVGQVHGLVTDRASGAPLAGVSVAVATSDGTQTATTGTDGSYHIIPSPGSVNVTVNAAGYEPTSATGNVLGGISLWFSPALLKIGAAPEGSSTLAGRVLDAMSGSPLAGAQVSLGNGLSTTTDPLGRFSIAGLSNTDTMLLLQAAGYQTSQLRLLIPATTAIDVGDLRLLPEGAAQTSVVSGTVRDKESGAPLAGATVTAAGQTVQSDATGHFTINGIAALDFTLSTSAVGYFGQQYAISMTEHGYTELNISLTRTAFGGIDILSLSPSQPGYSAFSEVIVDAALANNATVQRSVRLYVRVIDPQGGIVDEFSARQNPAGGDDVITIGPGSIGMPTISWYNRHYAPGTYRLWVQMQDALSSELLAERMIDIPILETRRVENVRLAPEVTYTTQGSAMSFRPLLSLQNRSNVPLDLGIAYRWRDPAGSVVHENTGAFAIAPGSISMTLPLDPIAHTFQAAGSYPFEIVNITGADAPTPETGAVNAAPDIRIEAVQGLEPGNVLPQGDTRLRMKIRIEGVQAP